MQVREQTSTVTLAAPAKLNLFLKVLGRRPDGFHELETLMVSVNRYDTLRFSPDPFGRLALICRDAGPMAVGAARRELPPTDGGNLVLRAAELLREATGTPQGARIELIKRIPLAAGLAGGSSDAAATLAGLNRLWRLGLSRAELMALGARLGSDIPFFLGASAAAVCRGRGEIIEPLAVPLRLHFVVARPATGLGTAEVYRHCRASEIVWSAADLAQAWAQGRLARAARLFHNALQAPAERLNREVVALRAWFARQTFVGHQMSGSGSAYFGLCRNRTHAAQLASRFRAARLGEVFVGHSRP